MHDKAIYGILSAPAEKRYKNFLNSITDREEVWVLAKKGTTVLLEGLYQNSLWPLKCFCELFETKNYIPTAIEVHEFVEMLEHCENIQQFCIFPTTKDSYNVSVDRLIADIYEHLSEIE